MTGSDDDAAGDGTRTQPPKQPPRVFVSYAHGSAQGSGDEPAAGA